MMFGYVLHSNLRKRRRLHVIYLFTIYLLAGMDNYDDLNSVTLTNTLLVNSTFECEYDRGAGLQFPLNIREVLPFDLSS